MVQSFWVYICKATFLICSTDLVISWAAASFKFTQSLAHWTWSVDSKIWPVLRTFIWLQICDQYTERNILVVVMVPLSQKPSQSIKFGGGEGSMPLDFPSCNIFFVPQYSALQICSSFLCYWQLSRLSSLGFDSSAPKKLNRTRDGKLNAIKKFLHTVCVRGALETPFQSFWLHH